MPNLEGNILLFDNEIKRLDLKSDIIDSIAWNNHEYKCFGPDNSFIVESFTNFDFVSKKNYHEITGRPLFQYDYIENSISGIDIINDSSFYCWTIDYDQKSNNFLYCGKYKSKDGLFILDSSYSLINDITEILPFDKVGANTKCKFIDKKRVIVNDKKKIYEINIDNKTNSLICDSAVLCNIANKKDKIIISYGLEKNYQSLQILDMMTNEKQVIEEKHWRLKTACFSPDDKFVTYTSVEGFLNDGSRVWIYDINSSKKYKTKLSGTHTMGLVWLN